MSVMSFRRKSGLAWLCLATLLACFSLTDGQNPHAPECNPTFISTSVMENQPAGTSVIKLSNNCSDPDGDSLTYKIEGDNANTQFKIDNDEVQANKYLDAEARLNYDPTSYATPWTLRISVTDGTNTSFVSVYIQVLSENDNDPIMNNLKTTLTLPEDAPIGTVVNLCTLSDADLPWSGHATPSVNITAGNTDEKFALDPVTCEMTLIAPLDYETTTSYSLTLTASDDGTPPRTTTGTVDITVINVNDHAPTCTFYNYIGELTEDHVAGETLLSLNCTDLDGASLIYDRLIGPTTAALDVNMSGDIILATDLDYDAGDRSIEIIVRVLDGSAVNDKSTTVTVAFTILDVDDQPPVFSQSVFTATVSETDDIGHIVLTLNATDLDSPNTPLSQITFGWETPCTQDWFRLDTNTGSIFVKSFLSWDVAPMVECQVFAYSSDKYDNRTTANVTINISDVNNNAPNFTEVLFEADLLEESTIGTSVLTVSANDLDSGSNGMIVYSMPVASPFSIEPTTGKVSVAKRVSYEKNTNFLLMVEAADKGNPSLTSSTYVSIKVLPENEYTPQISAPSTSIGETAAPGTSVTTITAIDNDGGDDGKVEYYLVDSNVPFILERETGVLRVGIGIDYETKDFYELVIRAQDKSQTIPKTSTATLLVLIDDDNDNDPVCNPLGPITVTPSTHNVGDILGTLSCTDRDAADTLLYIESGGDPNNIFIVDANQGIIRLRTMPVAGRYIYKVTVTDQTNTIVMTVEINVETKLQWVKHESVIKVNENEAVPKLLSTYQADGAYDTIMYSICFDSSGGKFNMNPMTGELRLIEELDREQKDAYFLDICAETTNGKAVDPPQDVAVLVMDVNDNTPKFSNSFTEISVSENVPLPTTITTITATDSDKGYNATLTYYLVSGNTGGKFQYDSSGNLRVISALDYDTVASYTLVLGVRDKGSPPLSSTTVVFVKVTNVDEGAPVIVDSNGKISLSLPEDTAVGAKVIHIDASDIDTGSELNYYITSGNSNGAFTIDVMTGDVYLVLPLDRETVPTMSLGIHVNNTDGQSDDAILEITITDVNDNDPEFSLGNYVFKNIPHNTQAGTDIGSVTVTDKDSGVNKDFTLSILSGDPSNRFTFSGNILRSAAVLDANVQSRYDLIVQAKDNGTPSRSSTAYVTVLIDPEFKQPLFFPDSDSISVPENLIPGTLYDTDATVAGAKEHADGDLKYSIRSGNSEGKFYIEPLTGTMQLVAPLSYATTQSYILVILAANRGNPTLTDTFTLTVTVTQINKYDPIFSQDVYTWNVNENAAVTTVVGRVTADDKDLGAYGSVRYAIESNSVFKMDATAGIITVAKSLEYSVAKSYNLYVTATDNAGTSSWTATAVVAITVIDFNNHAPEFQNSPYTVSVPETTAPGEVFYVVTAADLDSGTFGTVQHTITSGNSQNIFAMDPATGTLTLNQGLDYETSPQHVLTIEGYDGGTPSLTGTATVTINVQDENDNTPKFPSNRVDIAISGDTAPLTSIYMVTASDNDAGMNGEVNYIIQSGNDDALFTIDTVQGIMKTAAPLDTAKDFYTLIVIGVDQGLPTLTGTTTVGITVIPIDSTPPGDHYFTVSENEARGTVVGVIPKDPSRAITGYTIIGGNFGGAFSIAMNANQEGVLKTNTVLDRETYAFYLLHVEVHHASGIDMKDVSITVSDDNDNAPVFDKNTLIIQMVENLAAGNVIGAFTVTDPDAAGVNSEVHLSHSWRTPLGSRYFSVAQSGEISVIQPLSYEVFPSFTFEVIATDRGTPQQTSTGTVVINLVDVPETVILTPIESAYFTSTEMPDDVTNGEAVFTVTAAHVGQTLGTGAIVRYTTVDAVDSVFSVHPSTGVLTVQKEDSILSNARYFQWLIVSITSAGTTTSHALNVRIDTFNKLQHMVVITVGTDAIDLRVNKASFLSGLQSQFSAPRRVSIWKIQDVASTARRRLLATESEALIVVVEDDAVDDISNIDQPKTFMSQDDAAAALQASPPDTQPKPSLTGGGQPATAVEPYDDDSDDDGLSTELIILIVFAVLGGLALIIALIALIVYCLVYRRTPKDDKKRLVDKESRTNNFGRLESSAPPRDTAARMNPNRTSLSYGPAEESTVRGGGGPVSPGNMATNFMIPAAVPSKLAKTPSQTRAKNVTSGKPGKEAKQPIERQGPHKNGTNLRSDPHLNDSNADVDPDADGMPTRPVTATFISSSMTSLKPSDTIPQKNSSVMLASLEEEAEA